MDASLCREHLGTLLTEEAAALTSLMDILEQEFGQIRAGEVEALEQLSRNRDACTGRLMHIDAERQSLCRATGYSADKAGLLQLIQWCDPSGQLLQRWQQSTAAIRKCRNLNDRNGALVNSRLHRVEGQLQRLNAATPGNTRIYSARGNTYQSLQAGRVCNISA